MRSAGPGPAVRVVAGMMRIITRRHRMPMPPTVLSCLGALALELTPGTTADRPVLLPAAAGDLAGLVARDLAKLVPEAAQLDLGLVAALFDPVELLRPAYPLHAELERLVARAPGAAGGRVIGFGADAAGLPEPLRPDPAHAAGPLRLLPFVLRDKKVQGQRVHFVLPTGIGRCTVQALDLELIARALAAA